MAQEPGSILTLYRRLLAAGARIRRLAIGDFALLDAEGDVLAYERRHGAERLIVALNLGGRPHAWQLPDWASECRPLLSTVADAALAGDGAVLLRADEGLILWPIDEKHRKDNRVRIAMLAPISWRTPPRHYGPWELVTSLLTEALVARGVDVTLFATLDSLTAGKLAGVCPAPYSEDPTIDAKVWELLHVAHVFERAGEFDLIHNQADFVPLAFSRLVETPVVTTIHGFSSERIVPAFKRTRIASIMSRSAMPIGIRTCAMPRRSITASGWTNFPSIRSAAKTCCSSAASIPTRARPRRSRPRAERVVGW